MPLARRSAFAIGFVAALLIVACQQILAIDGRVTVPTDACGLSATPGSCRTCVATSCCDQAAACAAVPGCASYESCLLGCGADYQCRAGCVASNRVAIGDTVPTLDQCVVAHCGAACGVSCGATGSYALPDAGQACQDCIAARACGVAETCGNDLDCEELGHCALGCVTEDCPLACTNAHPDASAAFSSLIFGVGSECLTACSVGKYFACLGTVEYPLAKSQTISVTLTLSSSTSPNGVKGLTVKACKIDDTACSNPVVVADKPTDDQGNVTLVFPQTPKVQYGFRGYFDIQGPGVVPYLLFLSSPLSEEHGAITGYLLAQKDLDALTNSVQTDGGVPFAADPTRGVIAVAAADCFHNGAPGVVITATSGTDALTVPRYLDQTLSNTATETNRSGLEFFLNAPAGSLITFTATPSSVGRVSSKVSCFTRAGSLSYIRAPPTP